MEHLIKIFSIGMLLLYLFTLPATRAGSDDFGKGGWSGSGWSGKGRTKKRGTSGERLRSYKRNVSTQSIRNYRKDARPKKVQSPLPSYSGDRSRK
jgi:hypothetical protein